MDGLDCCRQHLVTWVNSKQAKREVLESKTKKLKNKCYSNTSLLPTEELKWYLSTNLTVSSYLIWTLLIDILRFPIMVAIIELSHEFPEGSCNTISCQWHFSNCSSILTTHISDEQWSKGWQFQGGLQRILLVLLYRMEKNT